MENSQVKARQGKHQGLAQGKATGTKIRNVPRIRKKCQSQHLPIDNWVSSTGGRKAGKNTKAKD